MIILAKKKSLQNTNHEMSFCLATLFQEWIFKTGIKCKQSEVFFESELCYDHCAIEHWLLGKLAINGKIKLLKSNHSSLSFGLISPNPYSSLFDPPNIRVIATST